MNFDHSNGFKHHSSDDKHKHMLIELTGKKVLTATLRAGKMRGNYKNIACGNFPIIDRVG